MTDTIHVIPVLGADGEPVMENGQILVQNQDGTSSMYYINYLYRRYIYHSLTPSYFVDNVLMYVAADYFEENSPTVVLEDNTEQNVIHVHDDNNVPEVEADDIDDQTEEVIVRPSKLAWPRKATKLLLHLFGTYKSLVVNGKLKNYE